MRTYQLALIAALVSAGVLPDRPLFADATLEDRINVLDREVKSLQEQVQASQQAHESRLTPPGQPIVQQNPPAGEATAGRSGFAIQSDDGNFVLRFQGLIQADGRFYTGDGANTQNYTPGVNASPQAISASQFLLRRVRPILAGTVYHTFDYFFQPDFGQNTSAIYDAYLDIRAWPFANLRAGKFKTPLGLERLQTDSYLLFAERGLTADLIPQRDTGLEIYGGFWENTLTYQVSFTNGVADGAFTPDSDTNNAKEGTARVFAQPFRNTRTEALKGLGLGLAGSYSGTHTAIPTYKTAAGQEQFFAYAGGTTFNGQRIHLVPQANYYCGPLGLYGEFAQTRQVAQSATVKTQLTNVAWQGAASWVLTGENASYAGVTPKKIFDAHEGTWGAFEFTTRFQQLQIDPETFRLGYASLATSASRATAYTVGLNWYLNKFVKFVANYETTWFNGGNGAGDRPIERVFDTRWQIAF
jgi:phosphate-selective porin OprO/OprP